MLCGQDESVYQVVDVRVVQLGVLIADQNLDVPGDHALEQLAEHCLIATAPPDAARSDRARQQAVDATLAEHELLGGHLGLGVEVVETLCVRHCFVTVDDRLPTHDHAVGRGVDEALDSGGLSRVDQILSAADVHVEAALAVLLGGRRPPAHQVDDRRRVEDRVDPVDRGGHRCGVADVALEHLEALVRGQRRCRSIEGADEVSALEQLGHQVGADESGAAGHQDAAQLGGQRGITHGGEDN